MIEKIDGVLAVPDAYWRGRDNESFIFNRKNGVKLSAQGTSKSWNGTVKYDVYAFDNVKVIDKEKISDFKKTLADNVIDPSSIKKVYITEYSTFGKRSLGGLLKDKGLKIVRDINKADAIFLNTTLFLSHIERLMSSMDELSTDGTYTVSSRCFYYLNGVYNQTNDKRLKKSIIYSEYQNKEKVDEVVKIIESISLGKPTCYFKEDFSHSNVRIDLENFKNIRSLITSHDVSNINLALKLLACIDTSDEKYIQLLLSFRDYSVLHRIINIANRNVDNRKLVEYMNKSMSSNNKGISLALKILDEDPDDQIADYFINSELKREYNIELKRKIKLE